MDYKSFIWIFLGGGLGSCLRYLITVYAKVINALFPWGTLIANLLGCFLIGLLMGYFSKWNIAKEEVYLLFIVGFCGGLTTFSSFTLDLINLSKGGEILYPLFYFMANILLGIVVLLAGLFLTR